MKSRFYQYLTALRKKRGYTQAQMAKALGISRSTYANYEAGKRSPDLVMLERISQVLECSIDELFGKARTDSLRLCEQQQSYRASSTTPSKMRLGIGVQDFRWLREKGSYYVDKTEMIHEFLQADRQVTLITRPRRFGKSLNMSMLAEFLDVTKDSRKIFAGTDVCHTDSIREMNQHPVVFFSFLNVKGETSKELLYGMAETLRSEYHRYMSVFDSEKAPFILKEKLRQAYDHLDPAHADQDSFKDAAVSAIMLLCQTLKEYYEKNVYLLIDEYDTPFLSANINGYYEQLRGFLSRLFSVSLKGNTSLEKAMLTGIQRVAKENVFSGLNNLAVCTVTDPEYAPYFGFTEKETRKLLQYYGIKLNEDIRRMYDGYRFGNTEIYNPWSITFYAERKSLEPYWVNTSEYSLIQQAIDVCGRAFLKEYEELLENGSVTVNVELTSSFYEQQNKAALWGMLINAGMTTIAEKKDTYYYTLRIPNKEVGYAFQALTAHCLQVEHTSMLDIAWHLKNSQMDRFAESYQEILLQLPSYHDLKDENSYHMMMLGMCAYLHSEYEVMSNRENGSGRGDLILKPSQKGLPGFIMEFKYTKDDSQELSTLATKAVKQIRERKYDTGINDPIYYIGLAHCGKKAAIMWEVKDTARS